MCRWFDSAPGHQDSEKRHLRVAFFICAAALLNGVFNFLLVHNCVVDEPEFLRYARLLTDLISSRIRVMLSDILYGEPVVFPAVVPPFNEYASAA